MESGLKIMIKDNQYVDLLILYQDTDSVITGATALSFYDMVSRYIDIVEVEDNKLPSNTYQTGDVYINSGLIEENPIYDEKLRVWYVSKYKALYDLLMYTYDNSQLEEALICLNDDDELNDFETYLESHNYDMEKWIKEKNLYLSEYL